MRSDHPAQAGDGYGTAGGRHQTCHGMPAHAATTGAAAVYPAGPYAAAHVPPQSYQGQPGGDAYGAAASPGRWYASASGPAPVRGYGPGPAEVYQQDYQQGCEQYGRPQQHQQHPMAAYSTTAPIAAARHAPPDALPEVTRYRTEQKTTYNVRGSSGKLRVSAPAGSNEAQLFDAIAAANSQPEKASPSPPGR